MIKPGPASKRLSLLMKFYDEAKYVYGRDLQNFTGGLDKLYGSTFLFRKRRGTMVRLLHIICELQAAEVVDMRMYQNLRMDLLELYCCIVDGN